MAASTCAAVTGSDSIWEILNTLGSDEHTTLAYCESDIGNRESPSAFA